MNNPENSLRNKQESNLFRYGASAFSTLFENLLDVALIQDGNGKILDLNRAGAKLLEWEVAELIGRNVSEILMDGDKSVLSPRHVELSSGAYSAESSLRSRSGGKIEVEARLSSMEFNGEQCVLLVARDITECRKSEDTIARQNELLKSTTESLSHPFCVIDANDYRIKVVNSAGIKRGIETDTPCYQAMYRRDKPDCFGREKCVVAMIKETGKPFSCEHEYPDEHGNLGRYMVYGYPVLDKSGSVTEIIAYCLNVSHQRQAEEDFRASEERFRNLMDYLPGISIQGYSTDGTVRYWNNASHRVYGYTAEEAIGKNLADLIIPDDLKPMFRQALECGKKATQSGELLPAGELLLKHKNGSAVPVYSIHTVVCLAGQENLMFCIDVDLSERKQMEEQLKDSEERLRTLFENAPIGQYRTTPEGTVLLANPAMIRMMGYESLEEMKKINISTHGYATASDRGAFKEIIEAEGEVDAFESTWLRRDGTVVEIEETARAIRGPDGKTLYYEGIVRDVTAKNQLEKELIKASKLESIGLLAGGIAHDFNNLLGALVINLWSAKRSEHNPGEVRRLIEESEKIAQRAKNLTSQLLTFSKGGSPVKKRLCITEIIKDTVSLSLGGSKIKCAMDFGADLPPVEVDEGQIGQVFSNLLINADQAMPEGGIVSVSVDRIEAGQQDSYPLPAGQYLRTSIRDNGHGIPKEYLSKVFDPYFTTKQKGSGLGLATAYSIVKKHGGTITVESDDGRGAAFHVFLPAMQAGGYQAEEVSDSKAAVWKIPMKIMIMDDEECYRNSLKQVLERMGHRVCAVGEGRDAIRLYESELEYGAGFDIVIMDLTIPGGMGGKQTITELRQRHPDIRAIVSSGYYDDPVVADYASYGFSGAMIKPFNVEDLMREIQRVTASGN